MLTEDVSTLYIFLLQLSSLYDVKPPISKGKMTSITRAALKAVKLYKHVVQSVEKFIQKVRTFVLKKFTLRIYLQCFGS